MKGILLSGYLAVISCDTIVTPTQTVQQGPAAGGSSTAAAPTVSPNAPMAINSITLEVSDVTSGCAEESGLIHAGCVARITATPRINGVVVPPAVHGPICTWFLDGALVLGSASTNVVYVTGTQNPFNLAVFGQAAGRFTLEAEVMAVRSGARTFVVQ